MSRFPGTGEQARKDWAPQLPSMVQPIGLIRIPIVGVADEFTAVVAARWPIGWLEVRADGTIDATMFRAGLGHLGASGLLDDLEPELFAAQTLRRARKVLVAVPTAPSVGGLHVLKPPDPTWGPYFRLFVPPPIEILQAARALDRLR